MKVIQVTTSWNNQQPHNIGTYNFADEIPRIGSVIQLPPDGEHRIIGEIAHRDGNMLYVSLVGGGECRVEFLEGLPSVPIERVRRMKISLLHGYFQGNVSLDLVGGEMGTLEEGKTYYFQPDILPSPLCFKLKDVRTLGNEFSFKDELTGTIWEGEYLLDETTSSTTTRTTSSDPGRFTPYIPDLSNPLIWGSAGTIPSYQNETTEEMIDRMYQESREQLSRVTRRRGYIDIMPNPTFDGAARRLNNEPLTDPMDLTTPVDTIPQANRSYAGLLEYLENHDRQMAPPSPTIVKRALVGCVMSRMPIFKENAAFETTVTDFAQGTDIVIGDIIKMYVETMVAEDRENGKYVISTAQGIFTITFLT